MRIRIQTKVPLLILILALSVARLFAQEPQVSKDESAHELFSQLNNLSIDPAQIYVLRDVQISRDRLNIYFSRGFIGFLGKVSGETTGAIFSGQGEVLLIPPNEAEKRSMARFTESPVLEENFTFAYLRFTDATAKELLARARPPDPEDVDQPTGFAGQFNPSIQRLNPFFSLRTLQDFLGERDRPFFYAQIQGVEHGSFAVVVDQRASEAVSVGAARPNRETLFEDTWCSFPSQASEAAGKQSNTGPVRAHSFKIETQINADNSMEGHAELDLESRSSKGRVLVFLLSSRLRVSEVRDEQGEKLESFQAPAPGQAGSISPGDDWFAVVLPSPHPAGSRFHLSFTYQGNVIADEGRGVLYVGARGSWYPNLGPSDRALYDLTFRYPASLVLVATGKRMEETTSGEWKHSRWISDGPFPVAGFNLGPYDSRLRQAGKTSIEVYATPEAEASLEKRHLASQPSSASLAVERMGRIVLVPDPKPVFPLTPAALLDQVAENALRAVKYFETLFGPYPYPRLAISQIPGNFGQGWPELVYLPTLSFLPRSERLEMGLPEKTEELGEQMMVAHEIAHQWWGNELGWKTVHDQWLSEGFANYAALLFLSQDKNGDRKIREVLRDYKHDLVEKTSEGNTIESGGPIWMGARLSNSLNPNGYHDIIYKKSCWVLRMLHVLMTDPATGSDARFFKMLRDFVAAYHDASPSTEDFIRHAEKYMTPAMDLDRNHRLDWFFREWVFETGIPTYNLHVTTRRLAGEKYVIQGTIEQSGVPDDFEMLVPVVAVSGMAKKSTLGLVAVTATGGHFKFTNTGRPSHVGIDDESLLAFVRQGGYPGGQ